MSNDVSIAVVKADDAFYVQVISGRSNLNNKVAKYLIADIRQKQDPLDKEEAMELAFEKRQEFIEEYGCYPEFGIENLDFSHAI